MRSLRSGQQPMEAEPVRFHLVLAGGGHTHALLLRRWLMQPRLRPAHTLITLVSRQSTAIYSGTLPALVAGLIPPEECTIDLRRLCALAGVSLLRAEIVGLDPLARELRLEGRPPLRFDRLSLDVGAVTVGPAASAVGPMAQASDPEAQASGPQVKTTARHGLRLARPADRPQVAAGHAPGTPTTTPENAPTPGPPGGESCGEPSDEWSGGPAGDPHGDRLAGGSGSHRAARPPNGDADADPIRRQTSSRLPPTLQEAQEHSPPCGAPGGPSAGPSGDRLAGGSGQPVKPLEPFLVWLSTLAPGSALRIRGGGAAAVELALALRARGHAPRLLLRGQGLRLGSAAANRLGERLLSEAGIPLERKVPQEAPADLACTGSRAPAWLAAAGLPVQAATGRVLTAASLQVLEQPHLFAAGDCAVLAGAPRPASGVWAVRATPVLATNLQRSLERPQRPLRPWRPQRRALQLLGDGGWSWKGPRAVVFWGPVALGPSRWLWHWKRHLDQRFLEGFAALAVMGPEAMACRGCAAKLAAAPLEGALARLEGMARAQAPSPAVTALKDGGKAGGDGVDGSAAPGSAAVAEPPAPPPPEDAAVLATAADGSLLLQSVDGFPALVADPWLNARLTTLHACGDLWASGAAVESVQALVTLPEAAPALQEELLLQTLAGVRSVLDPLGARLIGGHTLEGRDGAGLALALTVNGRVAPGRHWTKGPLCPGDALLLCGPLGSGVLFAAAAAGAAKPGWIDAALESMQRSQAPLVELLNAHGCRACTDITGFGLLGHLGEMLAARAGVTGGLPGDGSSPREVAGDGVAAAAAGAASFESAGQAAVESGDWNGRNGPRGPADVGRGAPPLTVRLEAGNIPAFIGALELLDQGWASSLAPANARALALLEGPVRLVGEPAAAEPRGTDQSPAPLHPADRAQATRRAALEALLIDPQTCGPLLAALPAERAGAALAALQRAGFLEAALIGTVQGTQKLANRG